ncbi:unnamed protein product [Ceutorhynchus assimilis]|uniref:Farnesol dehydrogenase n=1 Tax=Ceutorhynchus assimilis TaxID=467358 RepID=A0A9N9MF78_9CUCU|nr:unnamed protein product [Ceutorhynchus assimilis]
MVLSLNRWVGKVAVVTGASSGIGAAIAERLVRSGLLVAGLARRVERVQDLEKKLENEKGRLFPFKCDMREEEEVVATFKTINETVGIIQILINNAGLLQPTELIDGDYQKWKTTVDTNILGLCVATREAIKYMKEHEIEGHIIHINSILGHRVIDMPGINVYGASKFAVTALAEQLRLDILRNKLPIRITSISPGYVHTEFAQVGWGTNLEMPGLQSSDISDAIVYAIATPQHVNVKELELEVVGSTI